MTPKGSEDAAGPQLQPRFITLEDVAAYLSVSVPQVYAMVRSGDLPAVKIGGRGVWRVDKEQLDQYLEQLMEDTKAWTKKHPLQRPKDDSNGKGKPT
jgi:excisionase family DNA binding protein